MYVTKIHDHVYDTNDALGLIAYLKSNGWSEITRGPFDLARLSQNGATVIISPLGTIRTSGNIRAAMTALDAAEAAAKAAL